jgi:hypothetical protein
MLKYGISIQPKTAVAQQLPLRANAEHVRYALISGPYLKLIDWPKGANCCPVHGSKASALDCCDCLNGLTQSADHSVDIATRGLRPVDPGV